VKRDKQMLYVMGDYYVRQSAENDRFYVCDQEGCEGSGLEHIGDDYATLDEAKVMVDFWASGAHWKDRPDR
jgi:hypothetical protein